MPEAEAVVVFSCVGRIQTLDPLMNEEIESIKNAWNVPVTVMFSNSEMGSPTGGNLEMHKIKADAIALKEKSCLCRLQHYFC